MTLVHWTVGPWNDQCLSRNLLPGAAVLAWRDNTEWRCVVISIRTVVCPVDFSPATARQLELAVDVCRAFGSRLVVHHNISDLSVGAGVGWMWHADHSVSRQPVDQRMNDLLARVPRGVTVEGCITRGAATEAVLTVSDAADADLVILSTHGRADEDHASITEFMVERSNHAVLALHDIGAGETLPRFSPGADGEQVMQPLLVPTDLSAKSRASVAFAFDLARALPVKLHLLHIMPGRPGREDRDHAAVVMKERLGALLPADLPGRTEAHVEEGDPASGIATVAKRLSAACIVMGEHTRTPIRRWFTRDTSRAVLRQAPCPVWYVPAVAATARTA